MYIDKTVTYDEICNLNITYDLMRLYTNKLKKQKDDGDIGFNSNNIIYGSEKILVFLSLLFRFMLIHGFNPKELTLSTIISIPKDSKGSLSDINNYRGISLFNSIGKLFDYIIIELSGSTLSTSDMQFGFKK